MEKTGMHIIDGLESERNFRAHQALERINQAVRNNATMGELEELSLRAQGAGATQEQISDCFHVANHERQGYRP